VIPLVNRNAGSSYSTIPRGKDVLNRRPDPDDLDAASQAYKIAVHGAYSAISRLALQRYRGHA